MASRRPSSRDSHPTGDFSRRPCAPYGNGAPRPRNSRDVSSYSRSSYARGNDVPRQAAPSPYSRQSTQGEYARARAKKKRRNKVVGVVLAALAALTVGVGAAALAYVGVLNGKLTGDVGADLRGVLADAKAPTEPFYILLMGVDKSQERTESAEYEGDNFRSDSMILARVDPKGKAYAHLDRPRYVRGYRRLRQE